MKQQKTNKLYNWKVKNDLGLHWTMQIFTKLEILNIYSTKPFKAGERDSLTEYIWIIARTQELGN